MPGACCKRVFVVPLSLIMDNFWFYLFNLYIQCTWIYLLSFLSVKCLNFVEIGMSWVDLSESRIHVHLHCPERRFTKNAGRETSLYMWNFVLLFRIPRDSTRLWAQFLICRDLVSCIQ